MKNLYESIIKNTNIGRYAVGNRLEDDGYECIVVYNDGKEAYLLSAPLSVVNDTLIQIKGKGTIIGNMNISRILDKNHKAFTDFKNGWHIPDKNDRKLLDSKELKNNLETLQVNNNDIIMQHFWTLIKQSNTYLTLSIYYSLRFGLQGVVFVGHEAYIQLLKKIKL